MPSFTGECSVDTGAQLHRWVHCSVDTGAQFHRWVQTQVPLAGYSGCFPWARVRQSWSLSWCFEPSQPHRVVSGLRTPGTHGQTQQSSKDALGEETVLVLGHGGGAETVSEHGQCWYRNSVGTETVWERDSFGTVLVQRQCQNRDRAGTVTVSEQGQCWYRDNVGTAALLVQGQCWYRDSVGTGMVLVQGQCWYSSTVGTGTVLVQQHCWYRDSVGTGTVLVQGWCWYRDSVGTGMVLVQGQCWYRDSVGTAALLVQGRCWYRDSVGTGMVLVQGRCWYKSFTQHVLGIFTQFGKPCLWLVESKENCPVDEEDIKIKMDGGVDTSLTSERIVLFVDFVGVAALSLGYRMIQQLVELPCEGWLKYIDDTAVSWITLWGMIKVYWWYSS